MIEKNISPDKTEVSGSSPEWPTFEAKKPIFGAMGKLFKRSSKRKSPRFLASISYISLCELVNSFLISRRLEGLSEYTLITYEYTLKAFLSFIESVGSNEISGETIKQFLGHVRHVRRLSGVTVRKYLVAMKSFFHWAVEEGFVKENLSAGIKVGGVESRVVKALSPDELKLLLQSLGTSIGRPRRFKSLFRAIRNKALVYVLADCGLRVGELVGLTLEDVDIRSLELRVMGKGSRERYMAMSVLTAEALAKYLVVRRQAVETYGETERLWVGRYGGLLDVHGVQQEVAKIGQRIGLKLYPHLLRHTFGTAFLRNGANAFETQYALGHSTLQMTQRYCQALDFDDVRKKHAVASPVSNALLSSSAKRRLEKKPGKAVNDD